MHQIILLVVTLILTTSFFGCNRKFSNNGRDLAPFGEFQVIGKRIQCSDTIWVLIEITQQSSNTIFSSTALPDILQTEGRKFTAYFRSAQFSELAYCLNDSTSYQIFILEVIKWE
ncbi:hypothetical protein [Chitinophaga niabensis]|uniref:hypothetical protein n=1 Tax=Chitinophaga niabensis TaxID=536979 RepID=UPI000940EF3D|nr:hypothetical protein [Chitinophaga niabensis]